MTQTALISGSSRRIGRAIAERLAQAGYRIAIHARDEDDKDSLELCREMHTRGETAKCFGADLADRDAVARLIGEVTDALGTVTLLVNNASIFEEDYAHDFNAESWDAHMRINLEAPIVLARNMVAALPEGQHGNVINMIDQRVWRLNPKFFTYTLSKSALWTATRTMAMAFAPSVRVNGIGPGPTLQNERQQEADFRAQVEAVPLEHGPSPSEIAEAVMFIVNAPSMTGQMLALDGGQHLAWRTPDVTDIPE
ncbi:SDR family oxidoreductase [Tepidamorphus sp. 3E244]|uniref:SDR family oxidoreductase n=1 Tax=Tepidamorphus sp. 3E244 TaxID=3385498 RepID=UPI0038FC82E9